ncbi:MAG: radical SAM protein [Deltaproteobacteria bacterium]|nr:radical SAM protein [Deltaproteobacteria bacterium]
MKWKKKPLHINLEISLACNARCPFCDYWKVEPTEKTDPGLFVFLRKMNPLLITISGGEPLLRPDITDYIQAIKRAVPISHLTLISNASLLDLAMAKKLKSAGISHLCLSLDYLSSHHDQVRRLPGVYNKLNDLMPCLKDVGFDRISLNTIIMDSNLRELIPLAYKAFEWGVHINYSSYFFGKNGNEKGKVQPGNISQLEQAVQKLRGLKKKLRCISTSDYFFQNVVPYFKGEKIGGCQAGLKWIQVTPDGMIKRCSEMKPEFHFSQFQQDFKSRFTSTDCTLCLMSCRTEIHAPLNLMRMKEILS